MGVRGATRGEEQGTEGIYRETGVRAACESGVLVREAPPSEGITTLALLSRSDRPHPRSPPSPAHRGRGGLGGEGSLEATGEC